MTTTLRVRCDSCPRYGSVGPGLPAEALEDAGWRVVREEATCPACVTERGRVRAGPGIALSAVTRAQVLPPSDLRSPRHDAWIAALDRVR